MYRLPGYHVPDHHRLIRLGRRADVAPLLAAADVLAMSSEREGFPLAAAESLCAATPVIASAAPGLGWITEFRTGRTVDRNASAWASGLELVRAYRSSNDWAVACRWDAEDARRRFSAERGVADWRVIYDLRRFTGSV